MARRLTDRAAFMWVFMNNTYALAAIAIAVGLVLAAIAKIPVPGSSTPQATPADDVHDVPEMTTGIYDDIAVALSPSTYSFDNLDEDTASANERAFRDMIAFAEGTSGPDGYRTMFGHRLFTSFADHPRQYFSFTNSKGEALKTSAAGRYQFLIKTWDALRARLGLQDFTPASQDAACMELIRERGALNDVRAGRVAEAVRKCAPIWASLPGAGYSQPERKLTQLTAAYTSAGGQLTA